MFKILSKEGCKYCELAKQLLIDNEFDFEVQNVDKRELERLCDKQVSGYPQILLNDEYFGDYFRLEEYLEDEYEPLLAKNKNRFTIFPLKYHDLWELYKKAQMTNWTAEEIDLNNDINDWNSLNDNERHFISDVYFEYIY